VFCGEGEEHEEGEVGFWVESRIGEREKEREKLG